MTKFTAGPWHISQNKTSVGVYDASGNPVCKLPAAQFTMPRKLADAYLIAAAPDLLAALDLAVMELEALRAAYGAEVVNKGPIAIGLAALAKARGEA